jgi:hypothetical protein
VADARPGLMPFLAKRVGVTFWPVRPCSTFSCAPPSPKVSILNTSPSTLFSSAPHPPTSHTGRDTTDSPLIALLLTLELRLISQAICAFSYPGPPQIPFFLLQPFRFHPSSLAHLVLRTSNLVEISSPLMFYLDE